MFCDIKTSDWDWAGFFCLISYIDGFNEKTISVLLTYAVCNAPAVISSHFSFFFQKLFRCQWFLCQTNSNLKYACVVFNFRFCEFVFINVANFTFRTLKCYDFFHSFFVKIKHQNGKSKVKNLKQVYLFSMRNFCMKDGFLSNLTSKTIKLMY